MHAFVDEAGDRSHSAKASDHFVMSAVVIEDSDLRAASQMLADLRTDLGRRPGDTLHWRNLKTHSQRLHAAGTVGAFGGIVVTNVVVCKRHFSETAIRDADPAYLYTFRYILERISWYARDNDGTIDYTLAHVVRFKKAKLRQYEELLKLDPSCQVHLASIERTGQLEQPSKVEHLQIADICASAVFNAFEPDRYGNTEQRYLLELGPRFYRRPSGKLTSYGLKIHPWNDDTRALYPWIDSLG